MRCAATRIGEVAVPLGHRRNAEIARISALLVIPFLAVEHEQFVFLDRTADGESEVVALFDLLLDEGIVRVLRLGAGGEIIPGIQRGVTAEVEYVAVPLVGAALGHDVDDRARRHAVFRSIGVAQHLEFADRFDGGIKQNSAVGTGVVVVGTVNQEQVAGVGVSVDREVNAREQTLILAVVAVGSGDARLQLGQLHEAASIQRQFANLLAGDNFAQASVVCLYLNFGRRDRYLLGGAANLQLNVGNFRSSSVHFDVGGNRFLEVRRLHGHFVNADVEFWGDVLALCVGHDGAFLPGFHPRDGHRTTGYDTARRISNYSSDCARCLLRPKRPRHTRDNYEGQENPSTQSIHLFHHQKQISLLKSEHVCPADSQDPHVEATAYCESLIKRYLKISIL